MEALAQLVKECKMSIEKVEVFVDTKFMGQVEYSDTLRYILEIPLKRLNFMGKEGMASWLLEACALVEETLDWERNKRKTTSMKKRINYIRDYLDKKLEGMTREYMMIFYMNVLLSCQHLATLSGFGFGKVGSKYQVNAEVVSMRRTMD